MEQQKLTCPTPPITCMLSLSLSPACRSSSPCLHGHTRLLLLTAKFTHPSFRVHHTRNEKISSNQQCGTVVTGQVTYVGFTFQFLFNTCLLASYIRTPAEAVIFVRPRQRCLLPCVFSCLLPPSVYSACELACALTALTPSCHPKHVASKRKEQRQILRNVERLSHISLGLVSLIGIPFIFELVLILSQYVRGNFYMRRGNSRIPFHNAWSQQSG